MTFWQKYKGYIITLIVTVIAGILVKIFDTYVTNLFSEKQSSVVLNALKYDEIGNPSFGYSLDQNDTTYIITVLLTENKKLCDHTEENYRYKKNNYIVPIPFGLKRTKDQVVKDVNYEIKIDPYVTEKTKIIDHKEYTKKYLRLLDSYSDSCKTTESKSHTISMMTNDLVLKEEYLAFSGKDYNEIVDQFNMSISISQDKHKTRRYYIKNIVFVVSEDVLSGICDPSIRFIESGLAKSKFPNADHVYLYICFMDSLIENRFKNADLQVHLAKYQYCHSSYRPIRAIETEVFHDIIFWILIVLAAILAYMIYKNYKAIRDDLRVMLMTKKHKRKKDDKVLDENKKKNRRKKKLSCFIMLFTLLVFIYLLKQWYSNGLSLYIF